MNKFQREMEICVVYCFDGKIRLFSLSIQLHVEIECQHNLEWTERTGGAQENRKYFLYVERSTQ